MSFTVLGGLKAKFGLIFGSFIWLLKCRLIVYVCAFSPFLLSSDDLDEISP